MGPQGVAVAARLVLYIAVLGLFGTAALALYAPAAFALAYPRRAMIGAAGAALAATALGLGVLAAQITGGTLAALDAGSLLSVATGTGAGLATLVRFAALAGGLVVLTPPPSASPVRAVVLLVLAGVAVATLAWGGHAAASEGALGLVRLAADVLHLLAAGVWLGALAVFLRLMRSDAREDADQVQACLAQFSGIGSGVVAVLLLTGVVNLVLALGWAHLPSIAASLWGWLLLIKLVLFIAMLGLAAFNRFRLTPALGVASMRLAAQAALRRSLVLETATALLIIALVAWLGTLSPLPGG
jgi:putative copper resistance protein D